MASAYIPAQGGPQMLPWPLEWLPWNSTTEPEAGPTGVSHKSDETLLPFLGVVAIKFESDHEKRMTDKGYWEKHGATPNEKEVPYAKGGRQFVDDGEWKMDSIKGWTISKPTSHTGGQKIKLAVTVDNRFARRLEAKLVGTVEGPASLAGMQFVAEQRWYDEGRTQVIVVSDRKLPRTIEAAQFQVRWELSGDWISSWWTPPLVFAPAITSENELFITLGEPRFEDGSEITYERMAHAVKKAALAHSTRAHKIAQAIMESVPFNGELDSSFEPWFFARKPKEGADCFSISVYVDAILKMLGVPGTVVAVIVYVKPKDTVRWQSWVPEERGQPVHRGVPLTSRNQGAYKKLRLVDDVGPGDFDFVEDEAPDDPEFAGLNSPLILHHKHPWHLRLIDRSRARGKNNFEGCIKLTAEGKTRWYPGGVDLPLNVELRSPEDVVRQVFRSLSWIDNSQAIVADVEMF